MKAELISLFATLEFRIIDSKYMRTLSLSLTVPLDAIALYTSCKCPSIAGVSIVFETCSALMAGNGNCYALKTSSAAFSMSLLPMMGFTAVSEL